MPAADGGAVFARVDASLQLFDRPTTAALA
jgi:hypothetical protein